MLADEVFPRGFVAIGARCRQSEIGQVQRFAETLELLRRRIAIRERMPGARRQRVGKGSWRNAPSAALGPGKEPLRETMVDGERPNWRAYLIPSTGMHQAFTPTPMVSALCGECVRATDAVLECKGPAFARRASCELRLGKREGAEKYYVSLRPLRPLRSAGSSRSIKTAA